MAPVHVALCVLIIACVITVRGDSSRKLCDVRIWYLDLVTEGNLSGELSSTKSVLKAKIEKMIEKYKDLGRTDGQVDCNILSMYDDLLKTSQPAKISEDVEKAKENKDVDRKPSDTTEQATQASDSPTDDTDFDDTDLGEEDSVAAETESVQTKGVQISSDIENTVWKTDGNKDEERIHGQSVSSGSKISSKKLANEEYVFDPLKGYVKVSKEVNVPDQVTFQKDNMNTQKQTESDKSSEETSRENISETTPSVDASTQIPSEKNVETAKQLSSEEGSEKPKKNLSDKEINVETSKRTSSENKSDGETSMKLESGTKEMHSIEEQKSARSKGSITVSEEPGTNKGEVENDTNEQKKESVERGTERRNEEEERDSELESDEYSKHSALEMITDMCNQEDHCHHLCYYAFANRKCIEHYPDLIQQPTPLTHTNGLQHKALQDIPSNDEQSVSDKHHHEDDSVLSSSKHLDDVKNPDTSSLPKRNDKDEAKYESDFKKHENAGTDSVDTKTEDRDSRQGSSRSTDGEHVSVNVEESDSQTESRTEQEFRTHRVTVQNTKESQEDIKMRDFTADFHKFELLFQERVNEYGSKIQALEIMIMKLENQLLTERVTKQNDSNSFSRLENQILKLENELLKLNQSYVTLKDENDILRTRHGKYLELGHDQSRQKQLTENSTKHYELIAQQQNKISELNYLLGNHSNLFQTLQSRSNHLEEQNQILYQIVMNQTALISNIMKKVHELSEENIKQRHETQELKSKLAFGANSDRLLEKLDNLVSGSSNFYRHVVDDGKTEGIVTLNILKHFPNLPHPRYLEKAPCTANRRPRFCLLFSVILSQCAPHSTIHWSKCPYILKDVSQENEQGRQSERKSTEQNEKQSQNKKSNEHPAGTGVSKETTGTVKAAVQASPSKEPRGTDKSAVPPSPDSGSGTQEKKSTDSKLGGDASKSKEPGAKVDEVTRKILYPPGRNLPNYKDCYGHYQNGNMRNGVYKIYVVGLQKTISVYCDMKGGGWTVLYKRVGGVTDFYKGWEDYKNGFGGFYSDFWMGLDHMHYLTNQDLYSMRVDLTDFNWEEAYAEYADFRIDDEGESYRLHIDGYSGTAGDGFEKHNNMKFTTFDRDNDLVLLELRDYNHNCAHRFKGGWWYYKCYMANPTGIYYKRGEHATKFDGIAWKPWRKAYISMKEVVLKIRPLRALDD